jgi:hypothetical protein
MIYTRSEILNTYAGADTSKSTLQATAVHNSTCQQLLEVPNQPNCRCISQPLPVNFPAGTDCFINFVSISIPEVATSSIPKGPHLKNQANSTLPTPKTGDSHSTNVLQGYATTPKADDSHPQ